MSFLNPFRGSSANKAKGTAGSPLELINYDTNTGKFNLGKEALDVLRSVRVSHTFCRRTLGKEAAESCRIRAKIDHTCR